MRSASLHANVRRGRVSELSFTGANIDVSVSASQTGQARVSLRKGTYAGTAIRVATADLSFRTSTVTIRRMAINVLGGLIEGYGTIRKDGALNVSLAGTRIDLSELSKRLGYEQVTGQGNFRGSLTRQIKDPYLAVTFAVRNGRVRNIGYNVITGRLEAARGQLVFQDLAMHLPRGEIATAGRIVIRPGAPASLLLNLSARNIDLREALSVLGLEINASGLTTIDMDISGSLPNVQAAGTIVVRDAMLQGVSMDTVHAVLSYQGERILITAMSASRGQMTVTGQGTVMRSGLMEMSIAGNNLQLGIFNQVLSPYVHLEGPFDFSGQIRGDYRRPTVKGRISSSTLSVNQQAFGNFGADVAWNGRTITLSNVRLEQDNADYRVTLVTYTPSTSYLSLTVEASSVGIANMLAAATNSPIINLPKGENLRQFLATIPTPFTGTVDVSLSLRGPISGLSGTIFVTARDIHSGTSRLDTAGIELGVVASKFAAVDTALEGPEIRLRGNVLLSEERPVAVYLNVLDTKIPSLIALIENLPAISAYDAGRDVTRFVKGIENTNGLLNASIDLSNLEESPTGTISVSATSVSFRERQVGDVNANAHLRNGDVVLDEISIQPTQGQIALRGTIDREGEIALHGEVDSVQLSSVAPWFIGTDISGLVNASFAISGTFANPTVTGSIRGTDVRTDGTLVDSISAERIVISNGTLSFDRASVVADSAQFLISGSLPFMWTAPFVPRDKPLHLHAEALEADLSVLESLSQAVESASGPLVASVDIRGSLDSPILDGKVTVRNGRLKLYNLDNEIEDISMNAKFADSTMTIESFDGTSSLGGSLAGTGEISFGEPGGAGVSLFLMIDNMRIRMSETPMVENFELTVGGPLTVTGKLDSLAIRGQLVVSDANIRVPAEPVEVATLAPSLPMGPQLDVTLNIAHNVRIERGTLNAEVVGPVTVTGTVDRPIIAGTVQIVRGEISYIGRTLELVPGGAASFLFSGTTPPIVILEISARTQAFGISPLTGGITRYTLTLDISGPVGELAMDVRTSPPGLSDIEALSLLFSGTALDALLRGEPFQEVFQQQLGQVLLGLAVPGLFQPFTVGELTFVLVPNFDTPVQLSGSVNLTSRLVLSHSRAVTGIVRSELSSLSYVFSPRFAATIQFENVRGARQKTTYLIEYYTRF
ncbi:MAG: translocation/assembly module TamB domain-containing protein [Armatimonadetes bacterium]|nr:translocation/assembly module TamB domain-containing protein [Armatimonadota bacterium]